MLQLAICVFYLGFTEMELGQTMRKENWGSGPLTGSFSFEYPDSFLT